MTKQNKNRKNNGSGPIRVHLVSLGCPKNLVDSENCCDILRAGNAIMVSAPEDAQVIIVNTCGFIESAKREAIDKILEMAEYKHQGCDYLIVTGCLSQRYAADISRQLPEVDAILGTAQYHTIGDVINELYRTDPAFSSEERAMNRFPLVKVERKDPLIHLSVSRNPSTAGYAYLKIAEGCSNNCAYCAIPSIRGPFVSRPIQDLMREAEHLVKTGIYELICVAQDTTRYGLDIYGERALPRLIQSLSEIPALRRIRLLYCYPDGITGELIKEIKENEKVAKYIDMPIQHANDQILQRMNRIDTQASIRKVIANIRKEIPDITLRSTCLVGFPGETEEAFHTLLSFICDIRFDLLGCFVYSPEEGTPAYRYRPRVLKSVAEKRQRDIMMAQKAISASRLKAMLNRKIDVVIEGEADELFYTGRGDGQAPEIDPPVYVLSEDAPLFLGEVYTVTIVDCNDYEMTGVVNR